MKAKCAIILTFVLFILTCKHVQSVEQQEGSSEIDFPLNIAIIWHQHQPLYMKPGHLSFFGRSQAEKYSGRQDNTGPAEVSCSNGNLEKGSEEESFEMPWVRLHATKDYYDMAALILKHPGLKLTVNLVPSLLMQIEAYLAGYRDRFQRLLEKPVSLWSRAEREYVVLHGFDTSLERKIKPVERYRELLEKRGDVSSDEKLSLATERMSDRDLTDILVLFHLAWTDPSWFEEDPAIRWLAKKGRHFSEEDLKILSDFQLKVLGKILPLHKKLQEDGKIEVSTTPFFHPILPLLIDTEFAKRAVPHMKTPSRFQFEADAALHVKLAIEKYFETFGCAPSGMWPGEGSVAPEIIPLLVNGTYREKLVRDEFGINIRNNPDESHSDSSEINCAGTPGELISGKQVAPFLSGSTEDKVFRWVATDEEVLAGSLGIQFSRDSEGLVNYPEKLYTPYVASYGKDTIAVIFRDRVLSDRIGFDYSGMDSKKAAKDLYSRIKRIQKTFASREKKSLAGVDMEGHQVKEELSSADSDSKNPPVLVTIILDGENCWENYENDGIDFLNELYSLISTDRSLETVTVSGYLEKIKNIPGYELPRLEKLHSGSWIDRSFETWIGEDEENRAWEALLKMRLTVRGFLEKWKKGRAADLSLFEELLMEVLACEGSDWFWWYGRDQESGFDTDFDRLFRSHLSYVYRLTGETVPVELESSFIEKKEDRMEYPEKTMTCTIDGKDILYEPGEIRKEKAGGRGKIISGREGLEWTCGLEITKSGGVMNRSEELIARTLWGRDDVNLYIRVDFSDFLLFEKNSRELARTKLIACFSPLEGRNTGSSMADEGKNFFPEDKRKSGHGRENNILKSNPALNLTEKFTGYEFARSDTDVMVELPVLKFRKKPGTGDIFKRYGDKFILEASSKACLADFLEFSVPLNFLKGPLRFSLFLEKDGQVLDSVSPDGSYIMALPSVPAGKLIFEIPDIKGDDYGDGNLKYPSGSVFIPGSFDLEKFSLYIDDSGEIYTFLVRLGKIPDPWASRTGMSLATIDIYVDTGQEDSCRFKGIETLEIEVEKKVSGEKADGPGRKITVQEGAEVKTDGVWKDGEEILRSCVMLPGRRAKFEEGSGWNRVIVVDGWNQSIYRPEKKISVEPIRIAAVDARVDRASNTVIIDVLKKFLPGEPSVWKIAVAVMGQDKYAPEGNFQVRECTAEVEEWKFGGGIPFVSSSIVDLLFPGKGEQELQLGSFNRHVRRTSNLNTSPEDFARVKMLEIKDWMFKKCSR